VLPPFASWTGLQPWIWVCQEDPSKTSGESKMRKLVFFWDNFGPLHNDRCEAVARKFSGICQVVGLELGGKSNV